MMQLSAAWACLVSGVTRLMSDFWDPLSQSEASIGLIDQSEAIIRSAAD